MSIQNPTEEEAGDWADKLALEIALDMHRLGNKDARSITAHRLRAVRLQGAIDGHKEAGAIVTEFLRS